MKNLIRKNSLTGILAFLMFLTVSVTGSAQEKTVSSTSEIEQMQDENMDYLNQINNITRDWPKFSYTYSIENGKVTDVTVTGVEDIMDRKRLEVLLFDLKSNKNMMKNKANRVGVFYSVDEEASFNGGRDDLQDKLINNLKYPEDAKDWGVEGTIYVKFVVDENGEIPYATTATNIETSRENYLNDLEEQAVEAVKATSGEWEPAKVDGQEVASLAVVPVTFDFEKNPWLPALIR